jgi:hypothetical protein
MNAKTILAGTAIALALTAVAATPALAALTTFANFSDLSTDDFYYKAGTGTGASSYGKYYSISTPSSTTAGPVDVDFSFINEGSLLDNAVKNVTASFSLSGASTGPTILAGGYLIEPVSGTFTLKTTAPITVGTVTYGTGSILLMGSYTKGDIVGKAGTQGGSLGGDNALSTGDTLTYSSDFVTFQPNAQLGLGFTLSSVTPAFAQTHVGSNSLKAFHTDATASFSADPVPHVNAGVPEPASWALMIAGFGLAGASLRRRARGQATA